MIKKTLSVILASFAFFMFAISNSYSFGGFSIGASLTAGLFEADGAEKEADEVISSKDNDVYISYPSLFIEKTFANGFAIGASIVPQSLDTTTTSRTDVEGRDAGEASAPTTSDSGTSTVKASFENFWTAYVEVPVFSTGAYIKGAVVNVDVTTEENLHTGSTYGNEKMDGMAYGFGMRKTLDNDMFFKVEAMYSDFGNIELKSETNTANSVNGELEGVTATFAVGKNF